MGDKRQWARHNWYAKSRIIWQNLCLRINEPQACHLAIAQVIKVLSTQARWRLDWLRSESLMRGEKVYDVKQSFNKKILVQSREMRQNEEVKDLLLLTRTDWVELNYILVLFAVRHLTIMWMDAIGHAAKDSGLFPCCCTKNFENQERSSMSHVDNTETQKNTFERLRKQKRSSSKIARKQKWPDAASKS